MNLIQQLVNATASHPTAVFLLKNGDFVISSFQENEEEAKTLLINPMSIMTTINEVTSEESLTLESYLNPKIVKETNFFIDTGDVFSVHMPTEEMFDFYMKSVMKKNNISFPIDEATTKKKKKTKANTANDVIDTSNNVITIDFKNRANTHSLVNIYKEGTVFLNISEDDDDDGNNSPSAA